MGVVSTRPGRLYFNIMVEASEKKDREKIANGDKITVKRADLEAYRRKISRTRRTLETASTLLDELEDEYDRLTKESDAVS